MWPKDRVISNRLESIIQMFENNGEWPQRSVFNYQNGGSQMGNALQNSLNVSNLVIPTNLTSIADQRKSLISPMLADASNNDSDALNDDYYDQENSNNEQDYHKFSDGASSKYQKRNLDKN